MTFIKEGEQVVCNGKGFRYERIGNISVFVQVSKVPSLRVIRTMIKELEKLSNTKEV